MRFGWLNKPQALECQRTPSLAREGWDGWGVNMFWLVEQTTNLTSFRGINIFYLIEQTTNLTSFRGTVV